MRTALSSDHHRVIDLLLRLPNDLARQRAINNAATVINWRQPDAATHVLHRLQRISVTTARDHATQPQAEQSTGRER